MGTLIKIEKRENTIGFRTVAKDGKSFRRGHSSQTFLITKEDIEELFRKKYLVGKDIYSFASCSISDKVIAIEFFWLDSAGNRLTGETESIIISLEKFENFFYNEGIQTMDLINIEEKKCGVIKVNAPNTMAYIMKDKLLKRKLTKFLRDNFRWYRCDEIQLYDDYSKGSFCFTETRNGRRGICGGIILHDAGSKNSYFQIHT